MWLLDWTVFGALLAVFGSSRRVYSDSDTGDVQHRYLHGNKSYAYFSVPLTYRDAGQVCQAASGRLATIRDAETNTFIANLRSVASSHGYWVRIKDWDTHPDYFLSVFSGWSNGLPHRRKLPPGSDQCPYLSLDLHLDWHDADCNKTSMLYICQYENGELSSINPLACIQKGGPCFEMVHANSMRAAANSDCERRGGSLALIDTKETHHFLKSIIYETRKYLNATEGVPTAGVRTWAGVHLAPRQWRHVDGTPLGYTNWAVGEPNNLRGVQECGIFWGATWDDTGCSHRVQYVCEYPEMLRKSAYCQADKCYEYVDKLATFDEAQQNCTKNGGNLAMPKSAAINALLTTIYQKIGKKYFWFGARLAPRRFEYSDGTPLTFTAWASGQPDNVTTAGDPCVTITEGHKWDDVTCDNKYTFICEYEASSGDLDPEKPPATVAPVTTTSTEGTSSTTTTTTTPRSTEPHRCPNEEKDKKEASSTGDLGCFQHRYLHGNKTYVFFFVPLSYEDAVQVCRATSGEMVAIRDEQTNNFITKLRSQVKRYGYWINIKDWEKQGDSDLAVFSGWSNGLPKCGKSSAGKDRCPYLSLALHLDWHEADCNEASMSYICQYEKSEFSSINPSACIQKGGPCFEMVHANSTRVTAKSDCERRGGSLALIDTKETHDFLKSIIYETRKYLNATEGVPTPGVRTWAGVHLAPRQWRHVDGTPLGYTNWAVDQPDNDRGVQECGICWGPSWDDTSCSHRVQYVCEYPQMLRKSAYCQADKCYEFVDARATFDEAQQNCVKNGGNLAMPKSAAISDLLYAIYNNTGEKDFWIGVRLSPRRFEYSDGTPLTFTAWASGQPTYVTIVGDPCVTITEGHKWDDVTCDNKYAFICEYEASSGDLELAKPPATVAPVTTTSTEGTSCTCTTTTTTPRSTEPHK